MKTLFGIICALLALQHSVQSPVQTRLNDYMGSLLVNALEGIASSNNYAIYNVKSFNTKMQSQKFPANVQQAITSLMDVVNLFQTIGASFKADLTNQDSASGMQQFKKDINSLVSTVSSAANAVAAVTPAIEADSLQRDLAVIVNNTDQFFKTVAAQVVSGKSLVQAIDDTGAKCITDYISKITGSFNNEMAYLANVVASFSH